MNNSIFPGFPDSIRQSLTNPIQLDRLPDNNPLQTDFPVASAPPGVTRHYAIKAVLIAAIISVFPSLADHWLPVPWAVELWSLVGMVATIVVLICWLGAPKSFLGWVAYFFGIPAAIFTLVYIRSPFALLVVSSFVTVLVVDRFAKHVLYLGTSSPLPRDRSRFIRSKWRSRFFSLHTARGLEFYGLGAFALISVPWIYTSLIPEAPLIIIAERFRAAVVLLGLLICLPVLIELLASLFFARRPLGIRAAWKGFTRSMNDWFSYNYLNSRAPGMLQSPAGSRRIRNTITIALICMWVVTINPLFSWQLNLRESFATVRIREDMEKKKREFEARMLEQENFRRMARGESPIQPKVEPQKAEVQKSSNDLANRASPRELEPFQKRMLERMPEAERAQYLQSLEVAPPQPAPKPPAESSALVQGLASKAKDIQFDIENPHETLEYSEGENSRAVLIISAYAYSLVIPKLIVFAFAIMFPLAFAYANTVRLASSLREQVEASPDSVLSTENWNQLVDDVAGSDNRTEAGSMLLGVNIADNSPVLVPTSVFEEHAHILGDSGSGKTSMGIALILNQLLKQPDCSIVVIDLKGDDMALFEGTRIDAEAAGKRFRWFTNELGKSTFAFNPLDQEYFHKLSLYQKTDIVTASLGLQYGTDYGRGYFSDANSDYLYRTLQAHPKIRSFEQLSKILLTGFGVEHITYDMRKAASHIVSISQRLATTEALNVVQFSNVPKEVVDERIDFADVFRTPQVVYINLPSSLGTASSAEIARIALYSLIGSARLTPEPERKQVFVVIDEFQRIIANNLELIMQTARSMKVGMILANQSMLDLKKSDTDLTPAVRTNTRFKQVFAASNIEELKEMVDASGESLIYQRSFMGELGNALATFGGISKLTLSEVATPRLRPNDIMLATDAPQQSIVQIRRGMGYAQYGGFPFVMRSTYHISRDEFLERKKASWPANVSGTFEARELIQSSILDDLPPLNPFEKPTQQPNSGSASGVDDLLAQSALFHAEKREKYSNPKKPRK